MKLKMAEDLKLPLEAVTEKLAFLGRTGSGKTYAAMKLAELMLEAGAQVGVLDPVGVWRALRVPAPVGRSFDVVVFGGLYGDLPLEPTAGELIADLVVDRGLSFVLDVSQFIPSEQQRFVRAFADRFFHRKKAAPSAVHLFLEECQEFIPENPSGSEAATLGAMQRMWKLGRNFGIGGSLISQRPQEIAKKALNMSGTLFAFQMTGPQERKAVRAWVADHGVAVDIESVLQRLAVGQPHVESPTFLQVSKSVRILPRVTADLSSTPKVHGGQAPARRPLTPIDVEQLKTAMADTIERAKADDPKELRRQLAEASKHLADKDHELNRLRDRESSAPAPHAVEAKIVEVLTDADRELLREVVAVYKEAYDVLAAGAERVVQAAADRARAAVDEAMKEWATAVIRSRADFSEPLEAKGIAGILAKLDRASVPVLLPTRSVPGVRVDRTPRTYTVDMAAGTGTVSEGLSGAEQKILNALAELEQLKLTPVDRVQLALMAGYTNARSGGFSEPLGRLIQVGHVEVPLQGLVQLTLTGRNWSTATAAPRTARELQDRILGVLSGPEQKILQAILGAYPGSISRDELAERVGYGNARSGGFSEPLGRLLTLKIVQSPARGVVQASPAMFLKER